jgi:hypothetical protein
MSAKQNLRHLFGISTQIRCHPLQQFKPAGSIMAKRKAVSQVYLSRVEPTKDYVTQEVLSGDPRQLGSEIEHHHLVDADTPEPLHFLLESLKQRRRCFGPQYRSGMRIKRDYRGWQTARVCSVDDPVDYLLMTEVQAVKHAKRENCGCLDIL